MSQAHPPVSSAVILGGNGAMGSLFASMLASEHIAVTAIDVSPAPASVWHGIAHISADVRALSADAQRALAEADWVIAALPETVLLDSWETILWNLKPGALFVDTLSVKLPLVNAMAGRLPPAVEVVSINPMFAPSLGFRGHSVAAIEIRCAGHAGHFLELLQKWGATLQVLDAGRHDQYAAMLQTATHAAVITFGLALRRLGYDMEDVLPVMTPPHRTMLSLLARILNASPEVYWDIQTQNPHAAGARQALAEGLRELTAVVESHDQVRFQHLLNDLQGLFGPDRLAEFNRLCARMFKVND